jgi:hypothetical protein
VYFVIDVDIIPPTLGARKQQLKTPGVTRGQGQPFYMCVCQGGGEVPPAGREGGLLLAVHTHMLSLYICTPSADTEQALPGRLTQTAGGPRQSLIGEIRLTPVPTRVPYQEVLTLKLHRS